MTATSVNMAKLALMLCASFGLFLMFLLPRLGANGRSLRRLDLYLAGLAVLALFTYSQFGRFHHPHGFVHTWEMFNYYLPSKYFDELGYDGLYGAALAADWEDPEPHFARLERARDLRTNRIVPVDVLRRDPDFRSRFEPERWSAFKRDLAHIETDYDDEMWRRVFHDHGYNAPPPRTLFTRSIARASGPATAGSLTAIAAIDVLLLGALLSCVWRTFGVRVAALMAILLGTSTLSAFYWIGGSFLRFDWVLLAGGGLCALATGRYALAGALIGAAASFRVFPALFAVGVVGRGVAVLVQTGRWEPRYTAFVLGGVASALALAGASLLLGGGVEPWLAWYAKITLHLEPQFHNHIGLRAFLNDVPQLLWLARLGVVVAFALSLSRLDDLRAALLGGTLIYAFGFVTCYYYVFLILFALWLRRDSVDVRAWLFFTSLFLPQVAILALRGANVDFQLRYVVASVALLIPFAVLYEWIWNAGGDRGPDEDHQPEFAA